MPEIEDFLPFVRQNTRKGCELYDEKTDCRRICAASERSLSGCHLLFGIHSAQCTDARVNIVTKVLFDRYRTIHDFAVADLADVESIVHPCGLYKTKARDIIAMCQMLERDFDSTVPDEMEKLLKLPGIGRKTANLVLGDAYGKPAVVCDTHCIRITNHIGLTDTKDPLKCETQLRKLLPPEESNDFCHRLVLHGRAVCKARNPQCQDCCLKDICKTGKKA